MKYCISTNYFAAMTCDLSQEQFEQFYSQCCDGITQDLAGFSDSVSYRTDWSVTEDDERLERDIATAEMGISKILVRIFPGSILKTAPTWLNRNKKNFKNWLALVQNGRIRELDKYYDLFRRWDWEHLNRYLDFASEIRGNYQIVESTVVHEHASCKSTADVKHPLNKRRSDTNAMAKKSANDKLIEYIKSHSGSENWTSTQLGDAVGISAATVRKTNVWNFYAKERAAIKEANKATLKENNEHRSRTRHKESLAELIAEQDKECEEENKQVQRFRKM